jgi:hypothetical protein
MDAIMQLTQLVTVRPLKPEEHEIMMKSVLKLTELVKIAEAAIAKKESEAQAEYMTPPWNR